MEKDSAKAKTILGIKSGLLKYVLTLGSVMVLLYMLAVILASDLIYLRIKALDKLYFGFVLFVCGGVGIKELFFNKK